MSLIKRGRKAAEPVSAHSGVTLPAAGAETACVCRRPARGPNADYFPNVIVRSHEGGRFWFYDDLLAGKTVLISFMSVQNDTNYPVTENLARIQPLLGERLGREVFIYSITVDPQHDGPRELAAFAEKYRTGPGWLFLTGEPADLEIVRNRLFVHGNDHGPHSSHGPVRDCSMGLLRYGNEKIGIWGSVPAKARPEWIAKRLSWVQAGSSPTGPPRRKGPVPRGSAG